MTTQNSHIAQVDKVLNSFLLTGLADLVSLITRKLFLQPIQYVTVVEQHLTWCKELRIEDYSLSIADHAEIIRQECGDRYNVNIFRGQIIITVKPNP